MPKTSPKTNKLTSSPSQLFGSVVVGTKGQFVIPAEARKQFDIKSGDQLLIFGNTENNVLAIIKSDQVSDLLKNLVNFSKN